MVSEGKPGFKLGEIVGWQDCQDGNGMGERMRPKQAWEHVGYLSLGTAKQASGHGGMARQDKVKPQRLWHTKGSKSGGQSDPAQPSPVQSPSPINDCR